MPSCTPATLAYRPLRHGAGPALHSRARILFRRATVPGWSERTYGVSQSFTIGRRTTQRVRVGDPLVFRQPQTRGSVREYDSYEDGTNRSFVSRNFAA